MGICSEPITVEIEEIDEIYKKGFVQIEWNRWSEIEPNINSYHILKSSARTSALARYAKQDTFKLVNNKVTLEGLKPLDAYQNFLMDALLDEDIKIITTTGCAGSGKTLLSLAYGLHQVASKKSKQLLCTKPTEIVGSSRFFGAVPGDLNEKFAPFLDSFMLSAHKIFPDRDYLRIMIEKGSIKFKPIEFMRGDSYDDTILILDEAQNLNWASTKTVLTRLGQNSKVILIGDTRQKDIRPHELSGFELLRNSRIFKESSLTTSIHLYNDYRSDISKLVQSIADEIE